MTHNNRAGLLLESMRKNPSISQRKLANATGSSLGFINLMIKDFITKGYVKVSGLNKRKMEYQLTPLGLLEAQRKTHENVTETVKNFRKIQNQVVLMYKDLYRSGYDYFSIHGEGDLKILLQSVFQECLAEAPVKLGTEHLNDDRAVILNISPEPFLQGSRQVVNILERLSLAV